MEMFGSMVGHHSQTLIYFCFPCCQKDTFIRLSKWVYLGTLTHIQSEPADVPPSQSEKLRIRPRRSRNDAHQRLVFGIFLKKENKKDS